MIKFYLISSEDELKEIQKHEIEVCSLDMVLFNLSSFC